MILQVCHLKLAKSLYLNDQDFLYILQVCQIEQTKNKSLVGLDEFYRYVS